MAARWTEVTLDNRTGLNLRRASHELEHGVWDNDPPPLLIGDRGVWASESDGFLTGTEGRVTYTIETVETEPGPPPRPVGTVNLHWNNPFAASNSYDESVTPQATATGQGFSVVHRGGNGNDARVTFMLFPGLVEIDPETGELIGTSAQPVVTAAGTDRYAAIWEKHQGLTWQARHGLTSAQYQQAFDQLVADGFRLVQVNGYGVGGEDRYAAIWEKREGPAWQARHGLTSAQYQEAFDALVADGFRLVHVSGYAVGGQDRYAAIWEKREGPAWQARHGLTSAQYQETFDALVADGFRLVHVSGYAVGGQDRYAAIWDKSDGPAWQARHGLTSAQYQQAFDQLVADGFRLVQVSGYDVGGQDRYAAIWDKSDGPAWQARHGLTSAHYQATFDELVGEGFVLTCVSGYTVT